MATASDGKQLSLRVLPAPSPRASRASTKRSAEEALGSVYDKHKNTARVCVVQLSDRDFTRKALIIDRITSSHKVAHGDQLCRSPKGKLQWHRGQAA
eukprot:5951428-Lingulodinium_polyedra.AAC.1